MSGHTKGPWESDYQPDDVERGYAVIATRLDVPKGMTPTRGMVAWVGELGANHDPDTRKSNARLIAAAPDLYEALLNLYARCRRELADAENLSDMYDARLALAKAEGR
jgi:hypothetical protein